MPNHNKQKPLETNTTTSKEEVKTEVFFFTVTKTPNIKVVDAQSNKSSSLPLNFLGGLLRSPVSG